MTERRGRDNRRERMLGWKRLRDERREDAWMRKQIMRGMTPEEKKTYRKMSKQHLRHYHLRELARMDPDRRRSRDRQIVIAVMSVIILTAVCFYGYVMPFRSRHEPKTKREETNRDPAVYGSEQFMKFMMSLQFPELAQKLERTYVVPGLKATKTLQGDFRASAMCTSMTPQGMCVTENYVIVSAYCHIQKHNSVFYLIDRESGELKKTVPLGGKSHVGGVAYDPENRMIWVSGGTTGAAKAIAYRLKDLEDYNEFSREPVTAVSNYTLAAMIRNSYMTYYDQSLMVGLFRKSGLSSVTWYKLTEDGGLNAQIFADYDMVHESVIPDYSAVTSGEVQGASQISLDEERSRLLLSKSYGLFDSALQIHICENGETYFRDKDADRILRFPQKMEQICEADGKVYCLFESAAYAYRAQPALLIDRILVFDAEELFGDLSK